MHVKLYEDIARHGHIATTYAYPVKVEGRYVMDPSPTPKFDNPKMHMSPALQLFGAGREKRIYAIPPFTEVVSLDFEDHPFEIQTLRPALRALRRRAGLSRRGDPRRPRRAHVRLLRHRPLREAAGGGPSRPSRRRDGGSGMTDEPLLRVSSLSKFYGRRVGCEDVSFELWPGEVLAVVGESGSGKTTLLNCLSTRLTPTSGSVAYRMRDGTFRDLYRMSEAERRFLMRTDWGFVHQNPADGLRMTVSAGANVGERLMAVGDRHYGKIRATAVDWLGRVEIGEDRIDDEPRAFSGGMRQRLQIARNLVTGPRLVFMDEPTGGLDVSVQARLLDLLARPGQRSRPRRRRRHPRSRGGAAAVAPHDGDEGRPCRRDRPHRPRARRSARALHAASRLLDPAGLSHAYASRRFRCRRRASPCICATASACRSWQACPSPSRRANAPCSAVPPAPARARS